ncbi:MAG: COG1470 family protein [Limisphaerales bacterium]
MRQVFSLFEKILTKDAALFCALFFSQIFGTQLSVCAAENDSSIRLINHQDYSIHLPVTLRGIPFQETNSTFQIDGSNIVFIADISAKGGKELSFQADTSNLRKLISVAATTNGIELKVGQKTAGKLSWDISVEPSVKKSRQKEIASSKADYAKIFQPLPLSFVKKNSGAVFDTWSAAATKSGLALSIEVKMFHEGFLDLSTRLTNESAPTENVSAALICRWEHPALENRTLCYDNRRREFGDVAATDFHEKDGRFWHIQHGVDWVRSQIKNGPSIVWLNPFDPVFTVHAEAKAKNPDRFTMGSQAQFGHEAQSISGAFFSITEIARANLESYRDRVSENVLPARGESFIVTTRLAFQESKVTDDAADQVFLGTTSYREQRLNGKKTELVFGVAGVRFGTSYFPYSTLGENFDDKKLPGMDRESFWPLAADTVQQWPIFADEIRRDLRLTKWMGFKLIRLHHLELLGPIDKKIRYEYLDFLFGEMRHLGLKALLDVYASPQQLEELIKRYGDVIDGIEIENEILIWSIPTEKIAEWKQLYETVKKVAPHIKVNFTGQNNTGIFDRLAKVGVGFDRVGLHSYVDTLDALPSARGWALAAADFATRIGKPVTVTEWNYRGLTRMSPEDRAKMYPQIFEGALNTRSISDFYQFQFQETLAPNPVSGRGNLLRHYEIFNLSRHPKREAFEFAKIIQRYIAADDPAKILSVGYCETELDKSGIGKANLIVTNQSSKSLELKMSVEVPKDLKLEINGPLKISLAPHEGKTISLNISAPELKSGFYHGFIRFEGVNNFLRYTAIEARLVGVPHLNFKDWPSETAYSPEVAEGSMNLLTNIAAVVYGQDAPVIEVETAIAIAQTLESASGRAVPYFQLNDLSADARTSGNLILVGTTKTHGLVKEAKLSPEKTSAVRIEKNKNTEWLVVSGEDSERVKTAGMDFILRYWKGGKDSAAGKIGLVQKKLPRGIDPAKLP